MGRRIAAFVIDALIATVVAIIMFLSAAESYEGFGAVPDACETFEDANYVCFDSEEDIIAIKEGDVRNVLLVYVGIWAANTIVLQGLTGGTIGKLLLGLRVVDASGRRAGFGRIVVRSLMLVVDYFACFLIGLITALVSKGHRRVGDMVAGTYVVSATDLDHPLEFATAAPPGQWAPPPTPGWSPPGSEPSPPPSWPPPPPPN